MLIFWCELCQSAPSAGILEIVRKGETEPEFVQACLDCVRKAAMRNKEVSHDA